MRKGKGFTLVELLVVIIIVGVLASVAIPLMTGYINRAKKSEAIAALGVIRTGERAYYSENSKWQSFTTADATNLSPIGVQPGDLNGRYFSNACYNVSAAGLITCNANASVTVPNATEVTTFGAITIDSNGTLGGNYQ